MSGSPRDVRAAMQPLRPGAVGRIEKARDSRHALARLLPYLKPSAAGLALVLCSIVIATASGLLGPYLMGVAIDRYIAAGIFSGIPRIAWWMFAAYLTANVFQALADWIMASVSQRSLSRLRRDLFAHMQNLPIRFFDSRPVGELMSRLTNDIDAINQAVSQNVTSLFASVLSLSGILAAMFMLNLWLALASLLVAPIMFWFTGFVARSTRQGFRDLQRQLGGLNGVMEEALSGQKVIKAFRRNESVL